MSRLTTPVELSPHLHVVYAEFPHVHSGNAYLVGGRHPTLIDCGSRLGATTLIANLRQLGVEVTDLAQVVATHADYDHTQGYHELRQLHPGLPLLIHRHDWHHVQGMDPYRTCSYLYEQPFVPFAADACRPLEDGDVIPAGDGELRVIHAPGHTEGSMCLHGAVDGRRVLFTGDVVGGAMKSVDGADVRIWAEMLGAWALSLERLGRVEFDWILNGHEPVRSLPLTRDDFDRKRRMFGKMLNPWFSLAAEEDNAESVPPRVLGAAM